MENSELTPLQKDFRQRLLNLMEEKNFSSAEEAIQNQLFKENGDDFYLLYNLGNVYKKQNRWLEANDAYIRAKRYALIEKELCLCKETLSKLSKRMNGISFTEADYAKALYKVVSIYCYGRSGTHFFKSLLDGHPQLILTMLDSMKILKLWNTFTKEDSKTDLLSENKEKVIQEIFETFREFFNDGKEYDKAKLNGMCSMGEDRKSIFTIDKSRFKEKFTEIIHSAEAIDGKFFYQAVQLSAAYALGRQYDFKKGIPIILEGGIHFSKSIDSTEQLLEVFPYTRLLHMVRNPVIAFASSLKFLIKSGQATIDNLIANTMAIFADIPMKGEWVDRTYIIKLEDLHRYSKDILQSFCDLLDIEWSDTLLQSTFGGIKWWNTKTSEVLSGFNTKTISNTYDELLSSFDKFRLEILLHEKYQAWGYDSFPCNKLDARKELFSEPFKFEVYFANREGDFAVIRRILKKLFEKQFEYEGSFREEERIDFIGRLLSPEKEVL